MSLTPPNNLLAVSLTSVNSFSAVLLTPAKNYSLFGYFPMTRTPAINFSPVSLTPLNSLSPVPEYLREFSKKFKTTPREYLGAWGTLIHEKNLKSKISCQTPFKQSIFVVDGCILFILYYLKFHPFDVPCSCY